jgi:hypothetical protein
MPRLECNIADCPYETNQKRPLVRHLVNVHGFEHTAALQTAARRALAARGIALPPRN